MARRLLERDDVLALIDGLIGRAALSVGGAILVEGSAGMGKTAVLEELSARVCPAGVLAVRGVDLESHYPLGVARQLLGPALRRACTEERDRWLEGAAVAPAVLRGDGMSRVEEGCAFEALYRVLAAMTADRAMLLMVDDVHWCDPELLDSEFKAFPDSRLERREVYACAAVTWLEWTITGTHAGEYMGHQATYRGFELHGCSRISFTANGLIAEEALYFDPATTLRQLGLAHEARPAR